jgi:phosphatidylglycerol---prolipoprotein diacylglyceryl transferase
MTRQARRFDINKFLVSWVGIILGFSFIFSAFFSIKAVFPEGNNPIMLQLGPLTFRWYGVLITLGVIAALFMAMYLAERRGENPDRAWGILPVLLVGGLAGARFWYVVNTWPKFEKNAFSFFNPNTPGIFEIYYGGIAIQGAVIGALLAAILYKVVLNWRIGVTKQNEGKETVSFILYKRYTGFKLLRWADFVAPGLILAQGIGRWGNFFNNEAYGSPTNVAWAIKIPCEFRTSGSTPGSVETGCNSFSTEYFYDADTKFHPTFFYESVWDYFVFIILLWMVLYPKKVEKYTKWRLRDGDILFLYLFLYSLGRFFIEMFRTDALYFIGNPVDGGIRSAMMLAVVMGLGGLFALIWRHRRRKTNDDEALAVRVALPPKAAQIALANARRGLVATSERALLEREVIKEKYEKKLAQVQSQIVTGKNGATPKSETMVVGEVETDNEIKTEPENELVQAEIAEPAQLITFEPATDPNPAIETEHLPDSDSDKEKAEEADKPAPVLSFGDSKKED